MSIAEISPPEAVVIERLSRVFQTTGAPVTALLDADAVFRRGQLTVVVGPSGCGKSTLLNLLALLDRPSAGSIRIDGMAVQDFDPDAAAAFRRRFVGYMFQDSGLIEGMSVADNIALPLMYQGTSMAARRTRAREALEAIGLAARLDDDVAGLSGGERQRVALCRATIARPLVLVCDEPTAPLDAANGRLIAGLLRDYARAGGSVICSTHDAGLLALADQVLTMDHGRIASAEGAS